MRKLLMNVTNEFGGVTIWADSEKNALNLMIMQPDPVYDVDLYIEYSLLEEAIDVLKEATDKNE